MEYNGYLIRTDFGIGIQLTLCAADTELSEYEKTAIMLNLLYGRGKPDFNEALGGLHWFLSCGKESGEKEEAKNPVMDFNIDDARIYTAFRKVYGVDLQKQRLHWFEFVSMMQDIGDTAMSDVIGYRTADLSKMQGEQRAAYAKMKQLFALPAPYSKEEQEKIEEFLSALGEEIDD